MAEHWSDIDGATGCASQDQVDAIVAAARVWKSTSAPRKQGDAVRTVKRPLLRDPPKPPLRPSTDLLDRRIQEEIEFARRTLEAVGERIVDDPILLHRHQSTLQSFDIVTQLLGHLAKVIGSADRMEAIDRIGMAELRARLLRPDASLATVGTVGALQRSSSNPFSCP